MYFSITDYTPELTAALVEAYPHGFVLGGTAGASFCVFMVP